MYKKLFIFTIGYLIFIYIDMEFKFNSFFVMLFLFVFSFKTITNLSFNEEIKLFKFNLIYFVMSILIMTTIVVCYNLIFGNIFEDYSLKTNIQTNIHNIILIVLFSFFEEILFRKYILENLLEHKNKFKSIINVSICFALVHFFSNTGILYAFLLSILLSYSFYKTKSVLINILSHLYINLFVLFFLDEILNFLNRLFKLSYVS